METVIRGTAVFLFLLLVTRLSGRRTMAQVTPFDFVLLLVVAETTQQAFLGDDFSLTNSFLLIILLFSLDILLSYLKDWFPRLALFLDGAPTVLVSKGKPDRRAMHKARVNLDDILVAARQQHGLEQLTQVKFAILEADGNISIIPTES
ncbi:DUF421 domain-containing protein [Pseudorhizobium banfieldiae]|nr:YetF domain-containing protein [Pseudorhizobium banfieldiae]CAD6603451.1 hypothetical protein RNT25_01376 [arsenite-oxidising bacterium NT-25]